MRCLGLVLTVISAAVFRIEGGKMMTACILKSTLDDSDMVKGKMEEDEVNGWGPAPSPLDSGNGRNMVMHMPGPMEAMMNETMEEMMAGPTMDSQPPGGQQTTHNNNQPQNSGYPTTCPTGRGNLMTVLQNHTKPPTPHPAWGEWDWESDCGVWELEQNYKPPAGAVDPCSVVGAFKDRSSPPVPNTRCGWLWSKHDQIWELQENDRKKRQSPYYHPPSNLLQGNLQCELGSIIEIQKMDYGFSIDNKCRPLRRGCRFGVSSGAALAQVSHCNGQTGTCNVTVTQRYMWQCGRRTNFAVIQYQCIKPSELQSICENKILPGTQSLLLSSPSIAGIGSAAQAQFLSCECEVIRGGNFRFVVPWLKSSMDDRTPNGQCLGEMLLIEYYNSINSRYEIRDTVCGETSVTDKQYGSRKIKLSYVPNATPDPDKGFVLRIQGSSSNPLDVQCSVLYNGPSPTTPAAPAPAPGSAPTPASSPAPAASPSPSPQPSLPINLDGYSQLLNQTLAEFRKSQQHQQGSAAGQVASGQNTNGGSGSEGVSGTVSAGSSGVLSAVIATLGSVIVIMASVGVFLWHRRSQKKKQNDPYTYFDNRSIRSDTTLYAGTYQDPASVGSGIPTTLPPPSKVPLVTSGGDNVYQNQKAPESLQKTARNVRADGHPPALPERPARPPRPKKEVCRQMSSQEEEEVTYDNPARDIKVVLDTDYASLNEISNALGSQDDAAEVKDADSDAESQEMEMHTEA